MIIEHSLRVSFPVADVVIGDETRHPVITQSFRPVSHLGADVMFPRRPGDPPGHPRYGVPHGAVALALMSGTVVYAKWASNGWRVRLAHRLAGSEVHSIYLHLSETPLVIAGQKVTLGQPLGQLGADPTDAEGLVHLHFEARVPAHLVGRQDRDGDGWGMVAIDPAILLGEHAG